MILRLCIALLLARALTVGMTIPAIALSVALFLGARSGSVQLLLYSVFRIGNATNNVIGESYLNIADRSDVDWIVPISLGDSHRQFRVMGTTQAFFEHYKYRQFGDRGRCCSDVRL